MEILNQFGINPLLLAAQVVNFLILLFILKKFLYGPILKVLEERRKRIEESLKNAESIEQKLAETNETIEKMVAKASTDAQKILDEAKKEIDLMKQEGKVQAEELSAQIIKRGEETVVTEMEKRQKEFMEGASTIVVAAVQKVIGKSLTKKEDLELVKKAIKDI